MNEKENTMGYVYINEAFSDRPNEISNIHTTKDGNVNLFYITFDTNLQDFDVKNRNQRYYDLSNIRECIHAPKIQSLLKTGGWFGEFDHPCEEYEGQKLSARRMRNVPPDKRAFKIMNPQFIGNKLTARIQSAQGAVGESFGKEVLAGWVPQFSARAIATMVNRNGKPYVIVRQLITYDAPWYPSHAVAHATSPAKATVKKVNSDTVADSYTVESSIDNVIKSISDRRQTPTDVINGITIPLVELLDDVAKEDVNTQMIMEAFDLDDSALVGFSSTKDKILIKDQNNTIFANINPDSVRRVNDFYTSF